MLKVAKTEQHTSEDGRMLWTKNNPKKSRHVANIREENLSPL